MKNKSMVQGVTRWRTSVGIKIVDLEISFQGQIMRFMYIKPLKPPLLTFSIPPD